jgi:hypothetical protein
MGDLRAGLRARVPPSRASHEAAGVRFALTEGRLPTTAVNLTQIDSPLRAKGRSQSCEMSAQFLKGDRSAEADGRCCNPLWRERSGWDSADGRRSRRPVDQPDGQLLDGSEESRTVATASGHSGG